MTRNVAAARRRGVTLVEVLTAIFVMAIGLMALLTLFPLGALSMRQAIRDDQSGTASRNAESLFRAYWRYAVDDMLANTRANPDQNLYAAMMDPDGSGPMPDRTGSTGPSYPVYVDGNGWIKNPNTVTYPGWLADRSGTILRRAPYFTVTNLLPAFQPKAVLQHFSAPDDITLGTNAIPPLPNAIERQRRLSWAFLIRQSDCRRPRDLELTVVMYSNRPLQLTPGQLTEETAYSATFIKGSNSATISWDTNTQSQPVLRRGSWILDATMPAGPPPPLPALPIAPRGYFYRIVSLNDPVVAGTTATQQLELETPARAGDNANPSTAIVLEGVVDVFDRGTVVE